MAKSGQSSLTKVATGLRARALLGWMSRDQGIHVLINDCLFEPQLTARDAERIWRKYRRRTEALGERRIVAPERLPLSPAERRHADDFLAYWRSLGPPVATDVIKIDLSKTVIRQFCVVTEIADSYVHRIQGQSWLEECLPTSQPTPMEIKVSFNTLGAKTSAVVQVPHDECALFPVRTHGLFGFAVQQYQRDVRVVDMGDRLILKAGYHRAYALIATTLARAVVPSAVVAVERNKAGLTVTPRGAAARKSDDADFLPSGRRVAFFSDFFTEGLFLNVRLRRKRFELQIESKCVALDDTA
jgi:hypothetical protein